ncbi:MAG: hypothetical protein JRD93_04370 [Deltaproteobacteria bacterium]|nr:hypothetical protein [Deltaproteobacteria bacterium]
MIRAKTSNLPRTWHITGGCGFLGTNLITRLVGQVGCKIRVVDNLSVGTRDDLSRVCDFVETDKPVQNSDDVERWVGNIRDADFALRAAWLHVCVNE